MAMRAPCPDPSRPFPSPGPGTAGSAPAKGMNLLRESAMGKRKLGLVLAAVLSAGGGLPVQAKKDPGPDRVVVELAVQPAEALELTKAAFIAEGINLDSAEGGILKSVPEAIRFMGLANTRGWYTAAVLRIGEARSKVVLVCYMQSMANESHELLSVPYEQSRPTGEIKAIREGFKSHFREMWDRQVRIAEALRMAVPEPDQAAADTTPER